MASLLIIHGPNLNLLGIREPKYYGSTTLEAINTRLEYQAAKAGHSVRCFQANAEHVLIERIHAAAHESIDFIIINPAAFTHTSIALRDALAAIAIPFIEVHLSNIHGRETFRHSSYFSDIAEGIISGLGPIGYELALQAVLTRLSPPKAHILADQTRYYGHTKDQEAD
jgi:3-dehydroquinate dehydratase-2